MSNRRCYKRDDDNGALAIRDTTAFVIDLRLKLIWLAWDVSHRSCPAYQADDEITEQEFIAMTAGCSIASDMKEEFDRFVESAGKAGKHSVAPKPAEASGLTPVAAARAWIAWTADDRRGEFRDPPADARAVLRPLKLNEHETLVEASARILAEELTKAERRNQELHEVNESNHRITLESWENDKACIKAWKAKVAALEAELAALRAGSEPQAAPDDAAAGDSKQR